MWSVSILGPMSILLNWDSCDHLALYRTAERQNLGKTDGTSRAALQAEAACACATCRVA